jgi:hypothetical protein
MSAAQFDKVTNGCPCTQCGHGKMVLDAQVPLRRKPGNSELLFRCTVCRRVVRQVEDDRFHE